MRSTCATHADSRRLTGEFRLRPRVTSTEYLCALFTMSDLATSMSSEAFCSADASLLELVETVRALSYGRPSDRTVEGMLREKRGTCSTKHLFLAQLLAERFPETDPTIMHRVYVLDRACASALFGRDVAEVVPETGVVDVHRYLTVKLGGERIVIDATFPGASWDGHSSLPLACGPGSDYRAGDDPDTEKRELEIQNCDPAVREPFIAVLARVSELQVATRD